jgi:hypothetical protein
MLPWLQGQATNMQTHKKQGPTILLLPGMEGNIIDSLGRFKSLFPNILVFRMMIGFFTG